MNVGPKPVCRGAGVNRRYRSADQLPGQPACYYLVGRRQRFETRGEIRCLTGDRTRLPMPGPLEVADDDRAGGDPVLCWDTPERQGSAESAHRRRT